MRPPIGKSLLVIQSLENSRTIQTRTSSSNAALPVWGVCVSFEYHSSEFGSLKRQLCLTWSSADRNSGWAWLHYLPGMLKWNSQCYLGCERGFAFQIIQFLTEFGSLCVEDWDPSCFLDLEELLCSMTHALLSSSKPLTEGWIPLRLKITLTSSFCYNERELRNSCLCG